MMNRSTMPPMSAVQRRWSELIHQVAGTAVIPDDGWDGPAIVSAILVLAEQVGRLADGQGGRHDDLSDRA